MGQQNGVELIVIIRLILLEPEHFGHRITRQNVISRKFEYFLFASESVDECFTLLFRGGVVPELCVSNNRSIAGEGHKTMLLSGYAHSAYKLLLHIRILHYFTHGMLHCLNPVFWTLFSRSIGLFHQCIGSARFPQHFACCAVAQYGLGSLRPHVYTQIIAVYCNATHVSTPLLSRF